MERPNTALLCCEIICLEDHIELEAGDKFSASWLPVMKVVPQGSVPVGPLFFNVFISGNESVSMLMLTINKFKPRIKIQ